MEELSEIFSALNMGIEFTQALSHMSIAMPNIPFPTMGGEVFWDNICGNAGWKLQRNMFSGHYRILDPNNIRHAWGNEQAMMKLLMQISEY